MQTYKLYYSTYQAKDNFIQNIARSLKHHYQISKLLELSYIDGGTITKQIGFWKGKKK